MTAVRRPLTATVRPCRPGCAVRCPTAEEVAVCPAVCSRPDSAQRFRDSGVLGFAGHQPVQGGGVDGPATPRRSSPPLKPAGDRPGAEPGRTQSGSGVSLFSVGIVDLWRRGVSAAVKTCCQARSMSSAVSGRRAASRDSAAVKNVTKAGARVTSNMAGCTGDVGVYGRRMGAGIQDRNAGCRR